MMMSGQEKNKMAKTLEEVRVFNRQRLALLEEERNKIREEKNELERYLSALTEEISALHPHGVLELGLQRLENVCVTLLKAAEENSRLIMESAGMKTLSLQNQIKETERQIEQVKEQIQKELNTVYKMAGGSANPQSAALIRAWQADIFNNSAQHQAAAAHFQLKPEGTRDLKMKYGSGFADEKLGGSADGFTYQPINKFKEYRDIFPYQPDDRFRGSSSQPEDKAQESKGNGSSQPDEGLKNKIEETRYKYMIGKVAGEELVDNFGEVIIRKEEVINLEHIEKAKAEGKLSELIINMIVPGMDETR